MGIFNKLLAMEGLARSMKMFGALDRPAGYTASEWADILQNLERGNNDLIGAMNHGSLSSNWEHGGIVEPGVQFNPLKTTRTSRDPTSVDVGKSLDPMKAVVYHSHPSQVIAETGEWMPPILSTGDLGYALNDDRAITSLDPQGGMAWAIRNQAAPKVDRVTWDRILQDAELAAKNASPDLQEWTRTSVLDLGNPPVTMDDSLLAGTMGIGHALKNRGVLSHFGNEPGNELQQAGAAILKPATQAATSAAEDTIARWLKARGYSDGVIKSVIASLTATGSLISAVKSVEDSETEKQGGAVNGYW